MIRAAGIRLSASPEKPIRHFRLTWLFLTPALIVLLSPFSAAEESLDPQRQWPHWRGPNNTGASLTAKPPTEWSETKNSRWKSVLPGKGHSSPIVWGDLVFVTCAIPLEEIHPPLFDSAPGSHDNLPVTHKYRFAAVALNRKDGSVAWQATAIDAIPHEGGHYTGSLASASPVTDGKYLYASFGSQGLYAFDMQGKRVWTQPLGTLHTRHAHGEGSSPALHGDVLVVNVDHEGQSYIAAYNAATGERLWKTLRDEMTSWSTPLFITDISPTQVVVSATGRIRAYNVQNGSEIWNCSGLSRNVVASPVYGNGLLFAANSYDWQALLAIRVKGARDDLSGGPHVIWTQQRLTPYVPSPLLYGGVLYFLRHNQNILSGLNAATGDAYHRPVRLTQQADIFASPVAADGRIYIAGQNGVVSVYSNASPPEELAANRLDESFSASPALCDGEIFLRGENHLYCIARP